MKLIRVISEDNSSSGTIQNVFSGDLTLKPNSTIGLAMASINLNDTNIDVNDNNSTFEFKLGEKEPTRAVNLSNGVYNQTTLVNELNNKMNSALDTAGAYDSGFQWKTTLDDGNLNIGFNRSSVTFPDYNNKTSNIIINTPTSSVIRDIASTGVYDQFCGTSTLFINSCGFYKAEILDNGVSNVDVKLIMGLTNKKVDTTKTELGVINYKYGVSVLNGYYDVIKDGISSNSGAKFEIGDTIDMNISQGFLNFCAIRANGDDFNLDSLDWDFESTHLALSIASDNTGFKDIKAYLDPYQSSTSLGVTYHQQPLLEYNLDDFLLGATNTKVSLIFTNSSKSLLGFLKNIYSINLKSSNFKAENGLSEATKSPSILVELSSINTLQSFDGKNGERRSILGVIPALDMDNNNIVYQPSQILPIELNNMNEYKINQLVVRLLNRNDDQEIQLGDKGCDLVLVVS